MRMVFALGAAALPLLPRAGAAQEFLDRGVLVIARGSAETGRVEFAIRRTGGSEAGGLLLVAATRTPAHEVQYALELSRDSVPTTFQQTETAGGRVVRRVSAAVSGRRLSARASSADGDVARELPVRPPFVILGDEDYTAYYFMPRPEAGTTRSLAVVRTRDLAAVVVTVARQGDDTLTIAGRPLPCRRFAVRFPDGELRLFWISDGGALAQVSLPATGLVATRSEGPTR